MCAAAATPDGSRATSSWPAHDINGFSHLNVSIISSRSEKRDLFKFVVCSIVSIIEFDIHMLVRINARILDRLSNGCIIYRSKNMRLNITEYIIMTEFGIFRASLVSGVPDVQ